MLEGYLYDYMMERLDSARYKEKLSDEEYSKLEVLVEQQILKDLEEIPADSIEMEGNVDNVIEYYIEEIRNPE